MKLPALQKSSVAEMKTGLKRQDPRANNQNTVFPLTGFFCPHFGPGNLPGLVTAARGASPPRRWPVAGGMCWGPATVGGWVSLATPRAPEHPERQTASKHPREPREAAAPEEEEGAETRPGSCVPHAFASPALQKPLQGGKGWDTVAGCHTLRATITMHVHKAGGTSGGVGGMPTNPNQRVQPQMGTVAGSTVQGPIDHVRGSTSIRGGAHLTAIISGG